MLYMVKHGKLQKQSWRKTGKQRKSLFEMDIKTSICWNVCIQMKYSTNVLFPINRDSEAATQRCSEEKVFWKYSANLQKNTHAEVWFQ